MKSIEARLPKGHTWVGNQLQLEAEKLSLYPIDEKNIINRDMTKLFLSELEREVRKNEIVKIQINAKPRLGKSTLGIALGVYIHSLIKKYHKDLAYNKGKFSMINMARDEQEWGKKMRDHARSFDIIVTDEKNKLEAGGENATVEIAQREVFSDVQAGRYIHGIFICPDGEIDTNADIKLVVRNRQKGFIHSRLLYKLEGNWVLLGYVDIDVSKLIEGWKDIETDFYKWQKTDDKILWRRLKKFAKRDFYIEYMIKKYQKMELMNKEGVLRPRELDYASAYLEVVDKLKNLVKVMPMTHLRNLIYSYIESTFKKQQIAFSLIGVEMSVRRINGILSSYKSYYDTEDLIASTIRKRRAGKIEDSLYDKTMIQLNDAKKDLKEAIDLQINELKRYANINKQYNSGSEDW